MAKEARTSEVCIIEKHDSILEESISREISIIITPFNRDRILKKIGYDIDNAGFLVDERSKEVVKAEDDKPINVDTDPTFALIGGSHNFVRNIAGYSNYLASRGSLKFQETKD